MPMVERVYNRDDLYALVWSKTMREAAMDYGVSDVALKKVCRKLDVPTPPQGYWLRLASGRDAVRPELAPLRNGASSDFVTRVWNQHEQLAPTSAATEQAAAVASLIRIEVPEVIDEPHRLVAKTSKLLAKRTPSDGIVGAVSSGGLDVYVAPSNVDRAMRIMDALLKALEGRGFAVEVTPASHRNEWGRSVPVAPVTRVRVNDEWIEFSMSETVKIAPPPEDAPKRRSEMTWEERIKPRRRPQERRERTPTGTLVLTIKTGARSRHWRDRTHRRLETFLNEFVAHLYIAADWVKQERKRIDDERRRQKEAERQRIEAANRAEEQKRRIEELHVMLDRWRLVRDLREFASSIRAVVEAGSMKMTPDAPLHEYVSFVLAYADQIDPLRGIREEVRKLR
jgi:hypothetical protein